MERSSQYMESLKKALHDSFWEQYKEIPSMFEVCENLGIEWKPCTDEGMGMFGVDT